MKIPKSTVAVLLSFLLAGCAASSPRLPLPPALDYINDDPANVHFDRSSIYVTSRLIPAELTRPKA